MGVNFTTCVEVPALSIALGVLNAKLPPTDAEPPLRIDAESG